MVKNYQDIKADTFVKLYCKNKEIYVGLQSMNPLKSLPFGYNTSKKYFETTKGGAHYILVVL